MLSCLVLFRGDLVGVGLGELVELVEDLAGAAGGPLRVVDRGNAAKLLDEFAQWGAEGGAV